MKVFVAGLRLPIWLAWNSVNHTVPSEATATSKGLAPGVGTLNCVKVPEVTL